MRFLSVYYALMLIALSGGSVEVKAAGLGLPAFKDARGFVETPDGPAPDGIVLTPTWSGDLCRFVLENQGAQPVKIKQVGLFRVPHSLAPETPFYGEGFQMLSQTGGTLGKPINIGEYTDRKHYKMPQPDDATVSYGVVSFSPANEERVLLGFTSCKRFAGRFHVRADSIEVVLDTENLTLEPGEKWDLEEFLVATGPDRAALFDRLAACLVRNHPPRKPPKPPTGWCSWYCFGPRVTSEQILGNLDAIAKDLPGLKYVQVDDGYQRAMGDWLETGDAFGGGIRAVLSRIKEKGFEPAIWVAPFIAEKDSHLFKEHPGWFIKDASGKPLASNSVSFGGWRRGPWYALDGTHPEVQKHLESVFRTMREEWGCTYFKLDANFWGALHGGRFHDPKATRVEAYRRGMAAVIKGAGNAFLLGCNHPIWPSLALIDGSRSSGDITRKWKDFEGTARENLSRNWQNGKLWWNDPDCVVLSGSMPDNEYRFHTTAVYASGGMVLSGDDLTKLPADRVARLKKLLPPTSVAARFQDETLRVGRIALDDKGNEALCVFNWDNTAYDISVTISGSCRVEDAWTGKDYGPREGTLKLERLRPHSALLLICKPIRE